MNNEPITNDNREYSVSTRSMRLIQYTQRPVRQRMSSTIYIVQYS